MVRNIEVYKQDLLLKKKQSERFQPSKLSSLRSPNKAETLQPTTSKNYTARLHAYGQDSVGPQQPTAGEGASDLRSNNMRENFGEGWQERGCLEEEGEYSQTHPSLPESASPVNLKHHTKNLSLSQQQSATRINNFELRK